MRSGSEPDLSPGGRRGLASVRSAAFASWYGSGVVQEDTPDGELLHAIARRGADAADCEALLCRRFAPRIRLYGLRHLRSEDRARDLVQSVLVALLEAARAGRVKEPENFPRFVLGICRNTAIRMRQTDARAEPVDHGDLAELASVTLPEEPLELGRLMTCFDGLEVRAKEIVVMSFQDGRDASEIGTILGMSAGSVRVARHRAIAAIRRCLDSRKEDGPS
jgi:RNA polymerase sigma-70 factor (ECF subfamily)